MKPLERAWSWREARGVLASREAVRVFHGPGEGSGDLSRIAIDRFGPHYWVTEWEREGSPRVASGTWDGIAEFLRGKGAASAVALRRKRQGLADAPEPLLGEPPSGRVTVGEGRARFRVQLLGARHPGLFLDHFPLRRWLMRGLRGGRVLNCFAYTGSLSVASALGGASHVTTLDLSSPALEWARENWELNGLAPERARFIAGDCFEWLPRLRREGAKFGCVILDPPSFSRGRLGSFSTAKDLGTLRELALAVLAEGGILVISINSAKISREKFESGIFSGLPQGFRILGTIDLPETFPTRPGEPEQRYLKGLILRAGG